MIYRTEGINIMVRIFIQMILFDVRGSVSNYPPRLELPRFLTVLEKLKKSESFFCVLHIYQWTQITM